MLASSKNPVKSAKAQHDGKSTRKESSDMVTRSSKLGKKLLNSREYAVSASEVQSSKNVCQKDSNMHVRFDFQQNEVCSTAGSDNYNPAKRFSVGYSSEGGVQSANSTPSKKKSCLKVTSQRRNMSNGESRGKLFYRFYLVCTLSPHSVCLEIILIISATMSPSCIRILRSFLKISNLVT
jgi:hypothetical protein